jgi:hypothetical protein
MNGYDFLRFVSPKPDLLPETVLLPPFKVFDQLDTYGGDKLIKPGGFVLPTWEMDVLEKFYLIIPTPSAPINCFRFVVNETTLFCQQIIEDGKETDDGKFIVYELQLFKICSFAIQPKGFCALSIHFKTQLPTESHLVVVGGIYTNDYKRTFICEDYPYFNNIILPVTLFENIAITSDDFVHSESDVTMKLSCKNYVDYIVIKSSQLCKKIIRRFNELEEDNNKDISFYEWIIPDVYKTAKKVLDSSLRHYCIPICHIGSEIELTFDTIPEVICGYSKQENRIIHSGPLIGKQLENIEVKVFK